jgi:hypothetical protein
MTDFFQLVFISKSTWGLSRDEIYRSVDEIEAISKRNNPPDGITGAMLWTSGHYCQVLEGPSDPLEMRFNTIQQDKRHSACKILRYEPIEQRSFDKQALHVVGVFWEPVPGLANTLKNLGTIGSDEASENVINALLEAGQQIASP